MEPNENQFNSYFHPHPHPHHHHYHQHQHHHHPQQSPTNSATVTLNNNTTPTVTTTSSPTNGILPNTHHSGDGTSPMVYPHSVQSAVTSQLEPAKKKRGRPRKYFTPEQALAAKKAATTSSHSSSSKDKKEHGNSSPFYFGSSKKSQLAGLGNAGQGFTPHVINVTPGEDVRQKIMMFMQQSKREMCILTASGTISSVSLSQPATSGGQMTYEGCFEILSLSGSYVRTNLGGRSGGLSVSLSCTDGLIIGGGVCGPLKAASPVQVIVGTFLVDNKKYTAGIKVDESASKMLSPAGGMSLSSVGFHSTVDTSGRNPNHQATGGSPFMMQSQGMHMMPSASTEWRTGAINMELAGRGGRLAHQSPENGDYDQIHD